MRMMKIFKYRSGGKKFGTRVTVPGPAPYIYLCTRSEAVLRILTNEIVILERRVNTLENRVLPDLIEACKLITLKRDEIEHEELSRIFWVKRSRLNALKNEERSGRRNISIRVAPFKESGGDEGG